MKSRHRIVIKVGTSTLTQGTQKLSRRYMLGLVQQIANLQNQGLQVVLVSSGAIITGRELFNSAADHCSIPSKQTCASIGQVKLMQVWAELFSLVDLQIGQVLLTKDNFVTSKHDLARETLTSLLQHRIIPIINENDAVTTQETRIGDNDNLAALVANLIEADTLILLTDQEGLYTADPRFNPDATLISFVKQIDETIFALAGGASSLGTGGMITKIQAAQIASQSGTQTIIASSYHPNVLIELMEGRQIGTLFLAENTALAAL